MTSPVHFSSASCEWATPRGLFDELNKEFGFTLDVCGTKENGTVPNVIEFENALNAPNWEGVIWCNPPYGRGIGKWIYKAFEASRRGHTAVCLVPSRTDTRWWHEFCMKGEIRFIKGRLKFGDAKHGAPFPSAIVIFRGEGDDKERDGGK